MRKKRTSHVLAYYDSAKEDLVRNDLMQEHDGDESLVDELINLMKRDGRFDAFVELIDNRNQK